MQGSEEVEAAPDADALFIRFRERVFAAIDASIARCTVAIVIEDGTKAIAFRSGVLLQIADMHFLVTAGHDMTQYTSLGYRVGITLPEKGTHPVLLVEETFWTTKNDHVDISVTQLSPPVVEFLKGHYRYLRLPSVMSRHDSNQGRGLYVIYGFPDALIGPDETGIKRMESWRYLTAPFFGDYGTVENYDPALHLVVTYERTSRNPDGVQIHPPGMSGCGIWFVGTPMTRSLFTDDDFRLVAIQNCWHKKHEYAKGTWIDSVLLILWKYYPDTRNPLRLAGFNFAGC